MVKKADVIAIGGGIVAIVLSPLAGSYAVGVMVAGGVLVALAAHDYIQKNIKK